MPVLLPLHLTAGLAAGCCVFGHSAGGLAATLAEQRQPGTFSAMYLYEPVTFSQGGQIPGM